MSRYHNEHIKETNTVICDDWNNACALMKALIDISREPGAPGEYAICVTDEDGIRIDFKWVQYGNDSIVFCSESELYEIVDDSGEEDPDE